MILVDEKNALQLQCNFNIKISIFYYYSINIFMNKRPTKQC